MTAETAVQENQGPVVNSPDSLRGYHYKHGDRPLDGYTIQRGAGRGGFGEVYYAVSDSGREVALKLINTYEQIELRGTGQCMNLKSPHLVTIFDVRYGNDTRPWIIMEYVTGPSLRQLLDAAPSGLGTQKAAFFLREIAKGLTYLHDCGIVHRDLKPANIFYENGYVKIGDYGLSKVISTSQHSGQTVTVGTVHYMAPEIGAGNYDRGIDIYALGALLFEMLTGQVPFFGSSTAEVLMKHLSSEPDVSAIEEPFKTVIRKAMAKNPAERYQSVQEMVEAVFGSEHVRNSVSVFSPDSLTMVAGYAAQKVSPSGNGSFTPSDTPAPQPQPWQCDRWGRMAGVMDNVSQKMQWKMDRIAEKMQRKRNRIRARFGFPPEPVPARLDYASPFAGTSGDPLRPWHRLVLASIAVFIVGMIGGLVSQRHMGDSVVLAFVSTASATFTALLAWYFIGPALQNESPWLSRVAIGGLAGIGPVVLTLPLWHVRAIGGTALAIFIGMLLMNWRERLSAIRPERVMFGKLVTAALLGLIFGNMFDGIPELAITVLAGTTLAVGIAAPWNPRRRPTAPPLPTAQGPRPPFPPVPGTPGEGWGGGTAQVMPAQHNPLPHPPPEYRGREMEGIPSPVAAVSPERVRSVPRFVRGVWLVLFCALATIGLCLWFSLLALQDNTAPEERALMFGWGTGAMAFAVLALRRGRRRYFSGFWEYFFRPVFQLICVQSILLAGAFILMGNLHGNDMPPAIVGIVLPSMVLFVITFFAGRGGPMTQAPVLYAPVRLPPDDQSSITLGGIVWGLSRLASNLIGSVILLFSLLVALAAVTNLPGLFESGVLDPRMPEDFNRAFGTTQWPGILVHVGAAISFITAMLACAFLLVPRRRFGAIHMFRAIIAIGILFAAVAALGHALPNWADVGRGSSPADSLAQYLNMVHTPQAIWGGILSMLGIFMLLWPAARRKPTINYAPPAPPVDAKLEKIA